MKVIYVLKHCGRAGGHRVVMEHLNGLASRGHDAELVYLEGDPSWFGERKFETKQFATAAELVIYLASEDCVKVATWWETAEWVDHGQGQYYLVQDIETSYSDDVDYQHRVLNSYQLGLTHIVENNFQYAALRYMALADVRRIGIAIDHKIFCPRPVVRSGDAICFYRGSRLKNPGMLLAVITAVRQKYPGYDLIAWGGGQCPLASKQYQEISDENLADLLNKSSIMISTSTHEGFCLPILEAMACGTTIVSTRAVGNESFCIDGLNSLLADTVEDMASAIIKLIEDPELGRLLARNGRTTTQGYQWEKVIDQLEEIYGG